MVILYDEIIKTVDLTCDEINILKELLFCQLDKCISIGEELTIKTLIEKLNITDRIFH